jgi:hypothetical protein
VGSGIEFEVGIGEETETFRVEQTVTREVTSCGAEQKQSTKFRLVGMN